MTRRLQGHSVMRVAATSLALAVGGCGATLPNEESVLLLLSRTSMVPGDVIAARLVNGSSERLEVGQLPCTSQIFDQVSREPIASPQECDAYALIFEPGTTLRFNFDAPVHAGAYIIEVLVGVSDPDSEVRNLRIRSPEFTVDGPTLSN